MCRASVELLIFFLEKLTIFHPRNEALVVVTKFFRDLLVASLKTGNICPRLSCFLHSFVMVFVDALAAGNKAVIMVTDSGCVCSFSFHPGMVLGLLKGKSLRGVLFGQSKYQIKELIISLDFTVCHCANRVTVKATIVGIIRLSKRKLRKFQDEQNCSACEDIDSLTIIRFFPAQ